MLRGSVDISPGASGNDRGVFLEKINALLGATLLMKACPPRFSSKRCYGSQQSRIFALAIQGQVKLLVELLNPHRIVLCE